MMGLSADAATRGNSDMNGCRQGPNNGSAINALSPPGPPDTDETAFGRFCNLPSNPLEIGRTFTAMRTLFALAAHFV